MLTSSNGGFSTGGTASSSKCRSLDFATLVMALSAVAHDRGTGPREMVHIHRWTLGDEVEADSSDQARSE